jgi:hypothetical protein
MLHEYMYLNLSWLQYVQPDFNSTVFLIVPCGLETAGYWYAFNFWGMEEHLTCFRYMEEHVICKPYMIGLLTFSKT